MATRPSDVLLCGTSDYVFSPRTLAPIRGRAGPAGRIQVTNALEAGDEVLTLDEAAALLKLPADAVRMRADGEPHKRNRNR
jgi:hypothetical protein